MVQVLQPIPSFGEALGKSLGQGISQGFGKAADFATQMGLEKYKQDKRLDLINKIEGGGQPAPSTSNVPSEQMTKQFIEALPEIENKLGRDLTPQDLDILWKNLSSQQPSQPQQTAKPPQQEDSFRKARAYAAAGEHELARLETEKAKIGEKESLSRQKEEREILSIQPKQFLTDVENYRKGSRDIEQALDAELEAVKSGDVDPFSSGHIAQIIKDFDLPPSLAAPLETVGSKEFRTGQKTFLSKTFKDAFRGATTQGQVTLASSMLAEAGSPKAANLASIFLLKSQHMIEKERVRLTDEALDEGVSVYKLPRYVDKKLDDYAKKVNNDYFAWIKWVKDGGLYEQ